MGMEGPDVRDLACADSTAYELVQMLGGWENVFHKLGVPEPFIDLDEF